jgi:hypothetical protein
MVPALFFLRWQVIEESSCSISRQLIQHTFGHLTEFHLTKNLSMTMRSGLPTRLLERAGSWFESTAACYKIQVNMSMTRRNVLAAAALALPALEAKTLKNFGVQLYTLRSIIDKNPLETLKALEALGYTEAEVIRGNMDKVWDSSISADRIAGTSCSSQVCGSRICSTTTSAALNNASFLTQPRKARFRSVLITPVWAGATSLRRCT